ncbi:hypothetical protein [Neorhizobium sp. T7_12]|nr:hypothetical protein [Neorhizobium sp. T7_12]
MLFSPHVRKAALVLHVATSVGSIGSVATFLALAGTGLVTSETELFLGVYPSMDLITLVVIVPLLGSALLLGIIQALFTPWRLLDHWWVLAKLVISIAILAVLLAQLPGIARLADASVARLPFPPELGRIQLSVVVHSAAGLIVLLIPLLLSIYKPWGLTAFGRRKAERRHRR